VWVLLIYPAIPPVCIPLYFQSMPIIVMTAREMNAPHPTLLILPQADLEMDFEGL